jgi:Carboxypeptidase regulatory-like domain/TonB dependent receptor
MTRSSLVRLRSVSAFVFAFLMLTVLSFGQGYFGTVSGLITDPSGAVIPNAKVTLIDQEKGFTFDSKSDEGGRYLFRAVPPGLYKVLAEAPGFAQQEKTNIRVNVSTNPAANLRLKIGATTSIEVSPDEQHLDTDDATGATVVNRNLINSLPLIDRSVMELAYLAPGTTNVDDQCNINCTGTNFTSNGSRNATADVLMDGATVTNFEPNGGVTQVTYVPSPEAVEEMRVEQSNFSAEYGFSGGSIVNMITRSGTDQFHGEVYDFARNTITDANNWFNDAADIPLPPVHRQEFGGLIGGPIWRKKAYFFFDYDGLRSTNAATYQAGVPSAAERSNGDFGGLCGAAGGTFNAQGECSVPAGQIWDPYTGVYVSNANGDGPLRSTFIPYNNLSTYTSPGNPKLTGTPYQLAAGPGNLIDPVAQNMMKLFPAAQTNVPNESIYDNWIGSGATSAPNDQYDLKIDYRFNDKNLLSGKYSDDWNSVVAYNCFRNFADPCAGGPNKSVNHLVAINDTHTFSPTLQLTAIFGFTRGSERISAYNGEGGVTDPLSTLGFPGYLGSEGFTGVPAIYIGTYYAASGNTNIGGNPYGNFKQGQDTGQITIALDKVIGPHDFKFGFEGRQHQMNYIQTNAPNGIFNFDNSGSSGCPYTYQECGGDPMASFMMGQTSLTGAGTYELQDEPATEDRQYAFYGQENWKVNPKLTLNLGLRYDVSLPRTDRHNRQNWFDPTATYNIGGIPAVGGEMFASNNERHMVNTDWRDFQPRFGFAYLLSPKLVVRGGYGIYYSQSRNGASGVTPYGSQGYNENTNIIPTYNNDGATPYLHLSNPFPNGLNQPPGNSLGLLNDVGLFATGPLRNMVATPYEESWSFGFEQQLPSNMKFGLSYVGKKGVHLYFSGANYLNHLGPQVEGYNQDQINNLNAFVNNPYYGTVTNPNSPLSSPQVQQFTLNVPYPQFPEGVSTEDWPIAWSMYHAMQAVFEKSYSNGLQVYATYTWSKSMDDSSVPDDNTTWLGSFTSLQDPNKPWLEKSLSTFDIPQQFQVSYTWELPIGRKKLVGGDMPRWADAVIGGWKTNGIWRATEGRPMNWGTYDGTPLPTYGGQRPNEVAKPRRAGGKDSQWINGYVANPSSLVLPTPYTLGDAPRSDASIRDPGSFQVSASVNKVFSLSSIREGMNMELRLEAQNAFNHPTFGTPDQSIDDPNFGVISYTSNLARQMQLAAKINF